MNIDHHVNRRVFGVAVVIASATGFGILPIFARIAYSDGMDVPTLLFLRFSLAALLMSILVVALKRHWPSGRRLGVLVMMGSLLYVCQSWAFFSALQHAAAGLVALLLYLYPALVTIFGAVLFGEPLGGRRLAAVAVAFLGTALAVGSSIQGTTLGVGLGLVAAVLYAIYILAGSRVLREEDPLASAAVVMISAAVVFGVVLLWRGSSFPGSSAGWSAIAAVALLSTVVAMVGLFIGIRWLGASDAASLSTLEPLVTIAAAYVFLDEQLSAIQVLGAMVVISAAVWISRDAALRSS
jgi:drug/metabolite transporter (DMT)-like permease